MFKLPKGQINQVTVVLLRHQRDIPPPKNFYQVAGARSMKGTSVHLRMQKANHSIGFYGDLQGMFFFLHGDTTVGPVGVLLISNNNKYRVKVKGANNQHIKPI